MSGILTDYSKPELVKAIHDSWNSCMRRITVYPSFEYINSPQIELLNTNLNIGMFNRVLQTNLLPEETDQKIMELRKFFESRSLPFTWQVDPDNTPDDLAERLEKAGFKRDETPGMSVRLSELVQPKTPPGFTFKIADSEELVEKYAYLLAEAYGMPRFAWDTMAGFLVHYGVKDDYQHYIGYYEGKPVATSSILYDNGVAGLYNVANLPVVRRKGIGSMISYVPFIDAMERGYEIGILHSSRMGYNVYSRLGFEEVCRLVRYQWSPTS